LNKKSEVVLKWFKVWI